jgi:hypothetical protein
MQGRPVIGPDRTDRKSRPPRPIDPLGARGEGTALLEDQVRFDSLLRKEDCCEEGMGTTLGVRRGKADLLAFCFRGSSFTPATAWCRARRKWIYTPLVQGRIMSCLPLQHTGIPKWNVAAP